MLVIRNEQLQAFVPQLEEAFIARAIAHVRSAFPDRCAALGSADVTQSVVSATRKARGFGLSREVDILRYLNLMFTFGVDFDTLPWATAVLNDMRLGSDAKIDELMEYAFAAEAALLRGAAHG